MKAVLGKCSKRSFTRLMKKFNVNPTPLRPDSKSFKRRFLGKRRTTMKKASACDMFRKRHWTPGVRPGTREGVVEQQRLLRLWAVAPVAEVAQCNALRDEANPKVAAVSGLAAHDRRLNDLGASSSSHTVKQAKARAVGTTLSMLSNHGTWANTGLGIQCFESAVRPDLIDMQPTDKDITTRIGHLSQHVSTRMVFLTLKCSPAMVFDVGEETEICCETSHIAILRVLESASRSLHRNITDIDTVFMRAIRYEDSGRGRRL